MKSEGPRHKWVKIRDVRQLGVSPTDILAFACLGTMALISSCMMGFLLGILFMS